MFMSENEGGHSPEGPTEHAGRRSSPSKPRVRADKFGRPIWTITNAKGKKVKLKGGGFLRPPCPVISALTDFLEEENTTPQSEHLENPPQKPKEKPSKT
ncbi:MAG: hypothetical protein ABH816_01140 [Candidatus Levyibacteriota bacterium]